MRLKKLILKNYCQHRYLEHQFSSGLTGIIANNGQGKTNLINSLYFALTGESRGSGVTTDNITFGIPETEDSYVSLEFEHGGVTATVLRRLKKDNSNQQAILTYSNKEKTTIRGASKVNAEIESLLGLNKRMLSDFIFVQQKKISAFLSMRPADKAAAFQRLFGTYHAEKCCDAIDKYLATISYPVKSLDLENAEARLKLNIHKLKDVTRDIAVVSNIVTSDWAETTDPHYKITMNVMHSQKLCKEINAAYAKKELLEAELDKLHKLSNEHTNKLNLVQKEYVPLAAERDLLKSTQTAWQIYNKTSDKLEKLIAEKEKLNSVLQTLPKSEKEAKFDRQQYDILCDDIDALNSDLVVMAKYLAAFSNDDAECPTCGTATDFSKLGDTKHRQAVLSARYNKLIKQKQILNTQLNNINLATETLNKINALQEQINTLQVVEKPNIDLNEISVKLTRLSELEKIKEQLTTALIPNVNKLMSNVSGALNELQLALSTKEEELQLIEVTDAEFEEAVKALKHKKSAFTRLRELQNEQTVLQRLIEVDKRTINDYKEEMKKFDKVASWVNTLKKVNNILHRDALPKTVSQSYMETMEDDINKILADLGQNFRIKTTDDLGFIVTFSDGTVQSGERLSVGQQTVLSMAIRIVVNSTFAGDIGLLCLDEPTDGLDADNMKGLEIALEKLKEMSKARGLQCLLITHEQTLMSLFDSTLTLPYKGLTV